MRKREATGFGKELRKLRVDREETQSDMARRLGVSQALLSLIELGERACAASSLAASSPPSPYSSITPAAIPGGAARSAARLSVKLEGATACQREAAALFARRFGELTDAQCEAVKEALQR